MVRVSKTLRDMLDSKAGHGYYMDDTNDDHHHDDDDGSVTTAREYARR